MQLILESEREAWHSGEVVAVRLVALNDSYVPVPLDRRLLVGPNPGAPGPPFVSVEPDLGDESRNIIVLSPWCFYGRHRTFEHLAPGRATFHGYLLSQPEAVLLPEGPKDPASLLLSAEPLTLQVE